MGGNLRTHVFLILGPTWLENSNEEKQDDENYGREVVRHGRQGGIEYRAMGFEIWNKTRFFQLRIYIHIDAIAPGNPSPIDTYSNFVAPTTLGRFSLVGIMHRHQKRRVRWIQQQSSSEHPVGEASSSCPSYRCSHLSGTSGTPLQRK